MLSRWRTRWKRTWGHLVGPSEFLVQLVAWFGLALAAFGIARLTEAEALGSRHWSLTTSVWLVALGLVGSLITGGLDTLRQGHRRKRTPTDASANGLLGAPASVAPRYDLPASLLMIIDPSRYSPRTVERVCFLDGYYRHDVSRDFVIPDATALAGGQPRGDSIQVLLPVLRLGRQGALVDNLDIRGADGARLNTLNTDEYRAAAEGLAQTAVDALTGGDALSRKLVGRILGLLKRAPFNHLRKPLSAQLNPEQAATLEALVEELRSAPLGEVSATDKEDLWVIRQRVIDLCIALATDHIVFVMAKARPGDRIVVNYSFTAPHHAKSRLPLVKRALQTLEHRDEQTRRTVVGHQLGFLDSLRYRIGLRPHVHHVPITAHRWSQSYHLEFTSPRETYVHECNILQSKTARRPGSIVTFPPDGSRGADYVHCYVREAARTSLRGRSSMVAEIDCREKPPGLLGNIAILAATQTILIWIIGVHISRFFGPHKSGTDLPALLLALPGVAAGWLGTQFTTERLRSCSISTLAALLATGVLAIGTTGAALLTPNGDAIGSIFGIAHPLWFAWMALSLGLTLDLIARNLLRTHRYMQKIRFPDPDRTIRV